MSKSQTAEAVQHAADGADPDEHPWLAAHRGQRRWIPSIASLLCLLIGLSDVLAIFSPGFHARLHRINTYVPGTLTNAARSTDVIVGLLLMMLSHGLRRRKRRAWQAVLALLVLDIALHVIHDRTMHIPTTVVAAILLGTLLYFRRDFYAVGDWRTRWLALWVFIGLGLADLVIGLGYLSVSALAASYSLPTRLLDVTSEVAGVTGNIVFLSDARADTYHAMTTALGVFTLVVTAYLFLRPAEPKARLSPSDIEGIRQLLARHGERDSLAYFALRDDKSVIWSPTGKACIGYRVVSGVMLAGGDPLGDPEAWPGAIQAFLDQAARHAWAPAVMGCSELGAEVWCREGDLTALELGDEGVVNVAAFSLSGRPMRNVRQMCSRVARAGYTADVRRVGDVTRAEIDNILQVADSWRGSQTERGFSMALGRVGAPGDEQCVIATATCDGTLRAVLHFVPWGTDGLSLDLMRRDRDAQPGLNDFLIVEAIKAAPGLGVKRISLNFAVFRAALERGEKIGAGPVLRAWRSILLFLSKWFQIESLYKFNAKFNPVWQPRFFVFPTAKDAPRIALAALEAEAFLVWPTLEPRRLARQLGLGRLRRRLRRGRRRTA
jgi:lysyl-tRNA synthetase, class II